MKDIINLQYPCQFAIFRTGPTLTHTFIPYILLQQLGQEMWMTLAEAPSLTSTSENLRSQRVRIWETVLLQELHSLLRADYIWLCMEEGLMLTMGVVQSAPLITEVNFKHFNDDPIFAHFSSLHGLVLFLHSISDITETLSG